MTTTRLTSGVMTGVVCAFVLSSVIADDKDEGGKIVTVSFGVGLNTAQPGNRTMHRPETSRP